MAAGWSGGRVLADVLRATAAATGAFGVMAAVAGVGLYLVGAGDVASLPSSIAAVVALAVGGSVLLTADTGVLGAGDAPQGLAAGMLRGAAVDGEISLMPLGVTLAGSLSLVAFLRLPWSWWRHPQGAPMAVLVATVVPVTLLLTAVAAGLGQGRVDLGALPIGLGPGDRAASAVSFSVDLGSALLGGLAWVLTGLAVSWFMAAPPSMSPGRAAAGSALRPVTGAMVAAVLAGAMVTAVLGTAAGAVAGARGADGAPLVGAAVLGAPNAAWLALSLGTGVAWSGGLRTSPPGAGPGVDGESGLGGAARLPEPARPGRQPGLARPDTAPDPSGAVGLGAGASGPTTGGAWWNPPIPDLPTVDSARWGGPLRAVSIAVSVVVLLTAGVLAAAWTPRRPGGRSRRAGALAARLGMVLAVLLPATTALAGGSATVAVSLFGLRVGAALDLRGDLLAAAPLGLLTGAVAGAVGSLLVDAVRVGRRGRTPRPPAPGRSALSWASGVRFGAEVARRSGR